MLSKPSPIQLPKLFALSIAQIINSRATNENFQERKNKEMSFLTMFSEIHHSLLALLHMVSSMLVKNQTIKEITASTKEKMKAIRNSYGK